MNAPGPFSNRRTCRAVDVIVIGAGHAGLAMSRYLALRGVDHLVLERGDIANAWRRERWDSLRLLTPNWQSRLPGWSYRGSDPDGFMSMPEVVTFIEGYARHIGAPVRTGTTVSSVRAADDGYRVVADSGEWQCRALVIATGAFGRPSVPTVAAGVPREIAQFTPHDYRSPAQLPDGGVLVVGASATGLQLASEIRGSGRPVTLAVGEHVRLPRTYRGRDIQHWMDVIGVLDQRCDEVDDITRARRVPSPQLVGTPERITLDLNRLGTQGVECVGRLVGISGTKAQFSGQLRNHCALADLKMRRLLAQIDTWIDTSAGQVTAPPAQALEPTRVASAPRLGIDMADGEIRSIVWATGFRPDYGWLDVPVLNRKGMLRHEGGVVDAPGLYVLGLPFMRRRKSSFIHGADDDARELSRHLKRHLDGCAPCPAFPGTIANAGAAL